MAKIEPVPLAYNLAEPDGGAIGKPPVILLHSMTTSKEYWNDIPKALANATKRKVYSIDSRNHGESPFSDVFNFDCNVDDLLHFMDTIKAPKAILIGHSLGGITSIRAALKAPERVEKAVIEDMTVSNVDPRIALELNAQSSTRYAEAVNFMPREMDVECANLQLIDFFFKSTPLNDKMKFQRLFALDMCGYQNALKNVKQPQSSVSGQYEGPICFIYGKLSPFQVPKDEVEIKKVFPNAELVGIEGASHTVHNDSPAEFKEAILNFLLKE